MPNRLTTNEHEFTRILLAAIERKERREEIFFFVLCDVVVSEHWKEIDRMDHG